MNVEFAKIDDVNGVITVTLEEKDYADKVKKELKEVAKMRPEPGFRPGKTPMAMIQKKYGDSVKYEVVNKVVGDALFDYIKENKLHVLGNPVPDQENTIDIKGTDYTLKFKVGLAPEMDLHLNKDTHLPYYKIQITDEMVDRQDQQLRRRFGSQEEGEQIDDTAVVRGIITELDENGEPKAEGIVVENGILGVEHFKDNDQKNLFLGKKKGDVIVFNPVKASGNSEVEVGSMLHLPKEEALAHNGDFKFEVTDIIALKPAEEGEKFYTAVFGADKVHNHEEYVEGLKKLIEAQLERDQDFRFTIDAKKGLMEAIGEVQLPDEVLKEFLMKREGSNMTPENADEMYNGMRPELLWELVREAIAEKLAVKIEEEDVLDLARQVAAAQFAQYGMFNADEATIDNFARQILQDKKAAQQIASQAFDSKMYDAIKEAVTIDNNDVTVDQFNALFA